MRASGGVPRLVNILAHKSLLLGLRRGRPPRGAPPCARRGRGHASAPPARWWWWSRATRGDRGAHEPHQQDAAGPRPAPGARRAPTPAVVRASAAKPASSRMVLARARRAADGRAGLDGLGRLPAPAAQAARHRPRFRRRGGARAAPVEAARAAGCRGPRRSAAARRSPRPRRRACPAGNVQCCRLQIPASFHRRARASRPSCRRRYAERTGASAAKPARGCPGQAGPSEPQAAAPQPAATAKVDKRDRTRSGATRARPHFRRRRAAAQPGPASAKPKSSCSPRCRPTRAHAAARQALVSLLLEQRRVAAARRLLQEALALNPRTADVRPGAGAHPCRRARLCRGARLIERAASDRQGAADFQALRGAMLQRLGRHARSGGGLRERAAHGAPPATAWLGFAISLEALDKRSEAAASLPARARRGTDRGGSARIRRKQGARPE